MTLETAYMISQIAAVFFVGPTLLYLALQVRQNTVQQRAAARYQFVEATGQMNALVAGNKQTASVFRRGYDNFADLDEDEQTQFIVLMGHYFQVYSVMFELYQDKILPDTQWYNVRKDLLTIVASQGGAKVWEQFGKTGLHPSFVACVEELKTSGDAGYVFTKFT